MWNYVACPMPAMTKGHKTVLPRAVAADPHEDIDASAASLMSLATADVSTVERFLVVATYLEPDLCIGLFLHGVAAHDQGDFETARLAFRTCISLFRPGRSIIDYRSLNLDYILRLEHVVSNEEISSHCSTLQACGLSAQGSSNCTLHGLPAGIIFQPPSLEHVESQCLGRMSGLQRRRSTPSGVCDGRYHLNSSTAATATHESGSGQVSLRQRPSSHGFVEDTVAGPKLLPESGQLMQQLL